MKRIIASDEDFFVKTFAQIGENIRPKEFSAVIFDFVEPEEGSELAKLMISENGVAPTLNEKEHALALSLVYHKTKQIMPHFDSIILSYRSELQEMAEDAFSDFDSSKMKPGFRSFRAFLETLASFVMFLKHVEDSLDKQNEDENPLQFLDRIQFEMNKVQAAFSVPHTEILKKPFVPRDFSEKEYQMKGPDLEHQKPRNINEQVRLLSKSGFPSSVAAYGILSDFCHPNWHLIMTRFNLGEITKNPEGLATRKVTVKTEIQEAFKDLNMALATWQALAHFLGESLEFSENLPSELRRLRDKFTRKMRKVGKTVMPLIAGNIQISMTEKCICGSKKAISKCCGHPRFF